MIGPYYSFDAAAFAKPPADWCLPNVVSIINWYDLAFGEKHKGGPVIIPSPGNACAFTTDCSLTPTQLRDNADQWLIKNGFKNANDTPTPLDVYSMARNLRSEFGNGTIMERLCIVWSAINRMLDEGSDSVTANLIGTKGNYGRQIGRQRPASTMQDPSVVDLWISQLVYADYAVNGTLNDPSNGAAVYFDRVSQDAVHAKTPDGNPSAVDVYDSWSTGGDWLLWVGHIPDVRPFRLLLFKHYKDLRAANDTRTRATINALGKQAMLGQNRAPKAYWCSPT